MVDPVLHHRVKSANINRPLTRQVLEGLSTGIPPIEDRGLTPVGRWD
jgi:hypothetical protein